MYKRGVSNLVNGGITVDEKYYCNEIDKLYYYKFFGNINTLSSYFCFSSFFDKKHGAYFSDLQLSFPLLSYAEINITSAAAKIWHTYHVPRVIITTCEDYV